MATAYTAARNSAEVSILRTAWVIIYAYLDANRSKSFGRVGWKFIQFDITGDRLITILSAFFGGKPAEAEPNGAP